MATITRSWAMAVQDGQEQSIEEMRRGLAALEATGTELVRPHYLALLADVLRRQGEAGEGLRILDEAIAVVNRTGERYYEAELYRLKGELLVETTGSKILRSVAAAKSVVDDETPAGAKAEDYLSKAIRIGRQQKAKSLELRAVMRLARLLQKQDGRKEALHMLKKIYGSFTEGFDTADLIEARALLDSLSSTRTIANDLRFTSRTRF